MDLSALNTNSEAIALDGRKTGTTWNFRRGGWPPAQGSGAGFAGASLPGTAPPGTRSRHQNDFFRSADAFTLSAIMRAGKTRRIVEVGSGFSSAAIADLIVQANLPTQIVCIEPFPGGSVPPAPGRGAVVSVRARPVQEVRSPVFDELEARDILFIDSSMCENWQRRGVPVLRVLPRLKPGVLIRFHDIFYLASYPMVSVRAGRASNTLFLRRCSRTAARSAPLPSTLMLP